MANKKNVVRGRTKANKMIDLTKNRTSTPVTRYVSGIKSDMVRIMKHSNIPALMEMAKDSEVLQNYFLNRRLNITLLGDSIKYMDRALRSAIAEEITKDLKDALNSKGACYPGIWGDANLFSLCYSLVNITMMTDKPDKGHFLTVCSPNNIPTDSEKIDGLPTSLCMPFTEYNPNRLFQLCIVMQNTALKMISDTIANEIPSALMNVASDPVTSRFAKEFGKVVVAAMEPKGWLVDDLEVSGEIADQAIAFVETIEKPLVGYLMGLLSTSGLSMPIINEMFKYSDANAYYEIGDEEFATRYIAPGNKMRYILSHRTDNEDLQMRIGFECDVFDLYTIAKWTQNPATLLDKKILIRFGTALKEFFDNAVRYAINIHLIHNDDGTSLNEEAEEETPVESEVEIDDTPQDINGSAEESAETEGNMAEQE